MVSLFGSGPCHCSQVTEGREVPASGKRRGPRIGEGLESGGARSWARAFPQAEVSRSLRQASTGAHDGVEVERS